jgi:hypothetical protein
MYLLSHVLQRQEKHSMQASRGASFGYIGLDIENESRHERSPSLAVIALPLKDTRASKAMVRKIRPRQSGIDRSELCVLPKPSACHMSDTNSKELYHR